MRRAGVRACSPAKDGLERQHSWEDISFLPAFFIFIIRAQRGLGSVNSDYTKSQWCSCL